MLTFHVIISLLGILSGLPLLYDLLNNRPNPLLAAFFLITNILTSASGFPLPADHFMPSHAVAILCLISLTLASLGWIAGWRKTYVANCIIALYFNFFVLIAQTFSKVPILAPQQNGPLFGATQLVCLAAFILVGRQALRKGEK